MTGKQPEALRLVEMLAAEEWPSNVTVVSYARECVAELLRQYAENETLRAGYAAARLEIESLRSQAPQQGAAYAELPKKPAGLNRSTLSFVYSEKQMRAFADATHTLRASYGQAYPTIGDLCARIKAADDAAADRDYMLDSNDCIAVLRGEWRGPLTMDKPERASHGQAPAGARYEKELEDALRERDEADDCIDTLLDEVLGADRAEWSSAYGRADALEEVRERITALHKPAVERAWKQFEAATKQPGDVVAYLDVGAGGYLDLDAALSDEAMQQLPKGRHALVIAGTYGIDGYVAAPQPSPTAQADSVQEDAARYRWLREGNDAKHGAAWHVAVNLYGCEWDAAIDAARKQGASHAR